MERLTRRVLVLAAMIELQKRKAEWHPERSELWECVERQLMEWISNWKGITIDDAEIAFSFLGVVLDLCDPSHWPPNLVADHASADTRWAIINAPIRGELVIQSYIRKWELGWKRFIPWCGSIHQGLGIDWLHKAAESGNVAAERELADCYAAGEGLELNDRLAGLWYRKAAEHGDPVAQHNLGYFCAEGRGVPKDSAEAIKWYRASAEKGCAPAQYNLGCAYHDGTGVDQDYAEAAKWFGKAAEQGLAGALCNLGGCYLRGHGVPQNMSQAVEYYRKAASQGYAEAQYNLATCYFDGLGVNQDYVEAYKWLNLIPAKRLVGRLECARQLRDKIAEQLTSEQIAEAHRRGA